MPEPEAPITSVYDVELDARGLACPMPLLKAKQALNSLQSGQVLKAWSSDSGSQRDFASWCELCGHDLIHQQLVDSDYLFFIKKA